MSEQIDLGYLLQQAAKLYRVRFAEALRPLELTPQQAAVLMCLASAPNQVLTPRAVSDAVGSDFATTTGTLQRLERDGWLVSSPNPDDGRSRLVRLTPVALRSLPSITDAAAHVSASAGEILTDDERDTLTSLLHRLVADEPVVSDQADS